MLRILLALVSIALAAQEWHFYLAFGEIARTCLELQIPCYYLPIRTTLFAAVILTAQAILTTGLAIHYTWRRDQIYRLGGGTSV